MDWIEIARNILTFIAGTIAIAILVREGHVWWLERQARKEQETIERMEARAAVEEAEEFLKEIQR
jgi:hypothetical protein